MTIEEIRLGYIHSIIFLEENEKETEIKQLILDLMDACEQSDLGNKLNKLYNDFIR